MVPPWGRQRPLAAHIRSESERRQEPRGGVIEGEIRKIDARTDIEWRAPESLIRSLGDATPRNTKGRRVAILRDVLRAEASRGNWGAPGGDGSSIIAHGASFPAAPSASSNRW
jgi:hypothetical protein